MVNQIEEYEERKRLRRSRFRWRLLAVLALVAVAVLALSRVMPGPGPHVARFDVAGVIVSDLDRTKLLNRLAEDDTVEALLVHIDSPGGTVTGSEQLYEGLRDVAAKKPVIATMGDVAASGGYIAALAADRILAMGNSITGSVGVIFQAPNVHELMDRIGVEMVEVKSGDLKAEPNPFEPIGPEAIEAERILVEDSFDWFKNLVRERREIGDNAMAEIERGGVYTGRMALDRGLIDGIGGLDEARDWLAAEHDVSADLDLVPYAVEEEGGFPFDLLLGEGREDVLAMGRRVKAGLWAIWR